MGYCMEMLENTFVIKKGNEDKIVNAIKDFVKSRDRLMWIDNYYIEEAESIEDIFEEIRYPLTTDGNGDYVIDYFSGEKLGDDIKIFQVIAPYIEQDSFIEMEGEDGCCWKWVFKNGNVKEIYAKKVYDED